MKFYEVLQGGQAVGYFLYRKNATAYSKKFNTRAFVAPILIRERTFLDEKEASEEGCGNNNDTTSEWGGV